MTVITNSQIRQVVIVNSLIIMHGVLKTTPAPASPATRRLHLIALEAASYIMILPAHAPTAPVAIPQAVTTARRPGARAATQNSAAAAAAARAIRITITAAVITGAARTSTQGLTWTTPATATVAGLTGLRSRTATTTTVGMTRADGILVAATRQRQAARTRNSGTTTAPMADATIIEWTARV